MKQIQNIHKSQLLNHCDKYISLIPYKIKSTTKDNYKPLYTNMIVVQKNQFRPSIQKGIWACCSLWCEVAFVIFCPILVVSWSSLEPSMNDCSLISPWNPLVSLVKFKYMKLVRQSEVNNRPPIDNRFAFHPRNLSAIFVISRWNQQ